MLYLICIFIGIITAFIGSLVGLGGGAILIPMLLFLSRHTTDFAWATPQTVVGMSLIVMVFTALSSTISYFKAGRVDYRSGLIFLSGSLPGTIIGSWLNGFFSSNHFTIYFGLLIIAISGLFFVKRRDQHRQYDPSDKAVRTFSINDEVFQYKINIPVAFIISLIVGTISGMFGIGGGSIIVPTMILLFGFPTHIAIATSMFMIFFISLVGAGTHIVMGHIIWSYALFLIIGAWIGGKLGARVNQLLKGNLIEWILRITIVIIGIRLILDGLS